MLRLTGDAQGAGQDVGNDPFTLWLGKRPSLGLEGNWEIRTEKTRRGMVRTRSY